MAGTGTYAKLSDPGRAAPTSREARHERLARPAAERLRVDGKYFARGAERVRVHGVTYGPFADGMDGEPFPGPGGVDDDP